MRSSFFTAYKQIRNKLRKLHPESVLAIVLEQLKAKQNSSFDDLKRIPWHLLLIVKWTYQDNLAGRQSTIAASHKDIDNIRQMIWNIPKNTHKTNLEKTPINLFLRRVLRVQAEFQRGVTLGAFRELAILINQPTNSPLVKMFITETGLTPQEYLDFSIITFAAIKSGKSSVKAKYYTQLLKIYSKDKLDAYLESVSTDYSKLSYFLKSLPDSNNKVLSEIFEFPVLSRYPFFNLCGTYHCWHPTVFMRGCEGLVHATLSKYGQIYIDKYSKVFENYVIQTTRESVTTFLDEQKLRTLLPQESKVVDGLISFPGVNIYIEVKAGLYNESLMTSGDRTTFSHKTKSLRKAIIQAWDVSYGLRKESKACKNILKSETEFLLIITNKELTAGTGKKLNEIYEGESLQATDESVRKRLGLENTYIISVEDFERLILSAKNRDISLPDFLKQCKCHDSKPDSMVFYMHQHLDSSNLPMYASDLVSDCFHSSFSRMEHLLK